MWLIDSPQVVHYMYHTEKPTTTLKVISYLYSPSRSSRTTPNPPIRDPAYAGREIGERIDAGGSDEKELERLRRLWARYATIVSDSRMARPNISKTMSAPRRAYCKWHGSVALETGICVIGVPELDGACICQKTEAYVPAAELVSTTSAGVEPTLFQILFVMATFLVN